MSTKAVTLSPPAAVTGSWWQDINNVRAVRLALATTVTMLISQIFNWPIAYAAPALVVVFLELPIEPPSLRQMMVYLSYAVFSVVGGYFFILLFEPFPLVFIPAYTLVIFLSAYFLNKGASLVLIIFIVLTFVILPIVGNVYEGLTPLIAVALLLSMIVAILIVQLAHGLLPDPPGIAAAEVTGIHSGYSAEAVRAAVVTTATIVPVMILFLSFNLPAQLVIMLYVGILAIEGNRANIVYTTKKYLIANAIGGFCALLFYMVIVVVPEVQMLALSTLLVTLLFARRRFSDAHDAKYFGSALIGVVILISNSVGESADIDTNILIRVLFIFLAGMYTIGMASLIESLFPPVSEK